MGGAVSRVYGSLVRRPLQRYNVDHRAEKLITKFEDPKAAPQRAPMYETDARVMEEVRSTEEGVHKVQAELLDRLKQVYVSDKEAGLGAPPDPRAEEDPTRPLPRDATRYSEDFIPAQMRMERQGRHRTLPRGKVTLDTAVDIITKYQTSGGTFAPEQISQQYKISRAVAGDMTKYFEIFNMMETNTREQEFLQPDPLVAGKDWVDTRKTLEGATIDGHEENIQLAKEKTSARMKKIEEENRKLLEDKSS